MLSDGKLFFGRLRVPGFPGAHSQGETLDELQANLREVIEMLLEDENPAFDADGRNTLATTRKPLPPLKPRLLPGERQPLSLMLV